MAKCGACNKNVAAIDCARCGKCNAVFHRACVAIPETVAVRSSWLCPGCKLKIPREDNSSTPVKGVTAAYDTMVQTDDTTHKATEEVKFELALEIRSFRSELGAMRAELHECRKEIADFKESLTICNHRIDQLEERLTNIENNFDKKKPVGTDTLEETIAELKAQLNERDQDLLSNDLEIAGIPEQREESVLHIVKVISIGLGVALDERDVVHAERVGSPRRDRLEAAPGEPPRPRPIAVRVARRSTRDQLLRAARVRRGLTTADVELPGPTQRVYINERLTRINRQLFYRAREAGRRLGWKYIWTRSGKIFVCKEDGKRADRIRCDKDISVIFG